jgi:hypothetical protein
MNLLAWLACVADAVTDVLYSKACQIREQTAEHGMARYAEGYRDGYNAAMTDATGMIRKSTQPMLCGYLGVCREPAGHDLPHVVRNAP